MKGRSITVAGVKYRYRVGKQVTIVRLLSDDSVFAKLENHRLAGFTDPESFARGQWKRTSDGMVTPKNIAEGIERVLQLRKVDPTYGSQPWR